MPNFPLCPVSIAALPWHAETNKQTNKRTLQLQCTTNCWELAVMNIQDDRCIYRICVVFLYTGIFIYSYFYIQVLLNIAVSF